MAEVNCSQGCPHGCRYCYARYDLVYRKKELTLEEWKECRPLKQERNEQVPLYDGQVMFPAAHDIVPENLQDFSTSLHKLLAKGNRVLIVSKPHLHCIESICGNFKYAKDSILFRFTITAKNNEILQYWEPGAPGYNERVTCLKFAHSQGFATSVSIEPMLESSEVTTMVHELLPYVTHSIWLGKMNKIQSRVQVDTAVDRLELERIIQGQKDKVIISIFEQLKDVKLVKWKESIKEVVGLPLVAKAGIDR